MTRNEKVVWAERLRLMKAGRIGVLSETVTTDENGNKVVVREPDEIHDYDEWRRLGQQVRRGSRAIARLPITDGNRTKTVGFFCRAQCDTIWSMQTTN